MIELTLKQKEALDYIKSHLCEHHSTPTMFEITDHFNWGSQNSVQEFVEALRKKGYVSRVGRGKNIKINNCVLTLDDRQDVGGVKKLTEKHEKLFDFIKNYRARS